MALVECRVCGNQVSAGAKTCPKCGEEMPKKTSVVTWVIGGIFAFVVFSGARSCGFSSAPTIAPPIPVVAAKISTPPEIEVAKPASAPMVLTLPDNWRYDTSTDKMTGKEIKTAWVNSEEQLKFGFPYKGTNQPTLTLRKHPKYGTDVILQVDKGQMLCRYSGCTVSVKFDDKKPVNFSASEPDDHSSTVLFIGSEAKMIAGIKASKTVLIQATFYQEGSHVMEFKTEGLRWK